jgi:hypothetical protein
MNPMQIATMDEAIIIKHHHPFLSTFLPSLIIAQMKEKRKHKKERMNGSFTLSFDLSA